jgi:hypothetical protein
VREATRDVVGVVVGALLMVGSTMLVLEGSKDPRRADGGREPGRILDSFALTDRRAVRSEPETVEVAPSTTTGQADAADVPPSTAAPVPNTVAPGDATAAAGATPPPAASLEVPPTAAPRPSVAPPVTTPTTSAPPSVPTTTVVPEAPTTTVPCLIELPLLGVPLLCAP